MDKIKRIWDLKQTKIVLAVFGIIAILAAAFFLVPSGEDHPTELVQANSSSAVSESSTPDEESSQASSPAERSEADSSEEKGPSAESSAQPDQSSAVSSKTEKPDHAALSTMPSSEPASSQDQYQTDPVPEGKPTPQEPQDVSIDENKSFTCTLSIRCDTILDNMDQLKKGKESVVPKDGTILATTTVIFSEGESVFNILQRVTREKGIHMESKFTPIYNSAYVQGINNLYEFDCGSLSGWMFKVNGWFPNYGCSRYLLKDGDQIEWVYTCDLGKDVGDNYIAGQSR